MRHLMFELRPPVLDSGGLADALRAYAEYELTPVGIDGRIEDRTTEPLDAEGRAVLYRIAQEALHNIVKHANAQHADVLIECSAGVASITITDDGVGISAESRPGSLPGHIGLDAMIERARMVGGDCEVRPAPHGGTVVRAWIPTTQPPP